MANNLRHWIIAIVLALLVLAPHLKTFTDDSTRYDLHWGMTDTLATAAAVALLGTALFLSARLTNRLQRPNLNTLLKAIFAATFLAATIAILRTELFNTLTLSQERLATALLLLPIAVFILVLAGKGERLTRLFQSACLVLAPAIPITALQFATFTPYSCPLEKLPTPQPQPVHLCGSIDLPQQSVFLFVFDEWSYDRTFNDRQVSSDMPNLLRFTREATVYHTAYSPHRSTTYSLPRLIYQTGSTIQRHLNEFSFRDDAGNCTPVAQMPNLFSIMKENGLHTNLVGWALPYRRIIGSELDYCFTLSFGSSGRLNDGLPLRTLDCLTSGILAFATALPQPARTRDYLGHLIFHRQISQATNRNETIHSLALRFVSNPTPSFSMFHYSTPHSPFIYDKDGAHPDRAENFPFCNAEGVIQPQNAIMRYCGNLRYLDVKIGEIVSTMKRSGTFDDATIIMTSDHSWRSDPQYDDPPTWTQLTHVPLIIKHPAQHHSRQVLDEVTTASLIQLLKPSEHHSPRPALKQ